MNELRLRQREFRISPEGYEILRANFTLKNHSVRLSSGQTLINSGHTVFINDKSMLELKMDVAQIDRLVKKGTADAWGIMAAGREVLEWFANQPVPCFAMFGPQFGLPIPGISLDKPPAYAAVVDRLAELGHQRIVLITRRKGGRPEPRLCERAFLDRLEAHGVKTGEFNLPVWTETKEGLHELLTALFRVTPPTALLVDEPMLFAATQQFLADHGIRVPQQLSIICTDPDPNFTWCAKSVAHIRWDSRPVARRISRWANNVARDKPDKQETMIPAEFVDGMTVGPVWQGS